MKLYVPLTRTEFEALREVARAERRRPQDQAAFIVAKQLHDVLRQASALPTESDRADNRTPVGAG